jgi:hypothetical protein
MKHRKHLAITKRNVIHSLKKQAWVSETDYIYMKSCDCNLKAANSDYHSKNLLSVNTLHECKLCNRSWMKNTSLVSVCCLYSVEYW